MTHNTSVDTELFRRLNRARDLLASEPVTLSSAAHEACLSPFHFHRQFVRAFGQTPHSFAIERRFEEARRLLVSTPLSVGEICLAVGYESAGSFTTRFVREFGISPNEFRKGARRFWYVQGIRAHRFVPLCFVQNGKIREDVRFV